MKRAQDNFHRAYVGPADEYDLAAAWQFNLMTQVLGLRQHHQLLEIGCGSLRVARLFIPYLQPGHYCGLEPNSWLVEDGIAKELGAELVSLKRPKFRYRDDFSLTGFGQQFDFVLAQSIFSHTSKDQIRACLAEAKRVLKPTGVFAATFWEGESDYEGDSWVYPECVTFTWDTVTAIAKEEALSCCRLPWENQNGQTWVLFCHPEHTDVLPEVNDLAMLRSEIQLLKGKLQSSRHQSDAPAEVIRLCERLVLISRHPAVQALMANDPELQRAVRGAT